MQLPAKTKGPPNRLDIARLDSYQTDEERVAPSTEDKGTPPIEVERPTAGLPSAKRETDADRADHEASPRKELHPPGHARYTEQSVRTRSQPAIVFEKQKPQAGLAQSGVRVCAIHQTDDLSCGAARTSVALRLTTIMQPSSRRKQDRRKLG